jgi:hypothetical protein
MNCKAPHKRWLTRHPATIARMHDHLSTTWQPNLLQQVSGPKSIQTHLLSSVLGAFLSSPRLLSSNLVYVCLPSHPWPFAHTISCRVPALSGLICRHLDRLTALSHHMMGYEDFDLFFLDLLVLLVTALSH